MRNMLVLWVNLTGESGAAVLCERLKRHCCIKVCDASAIAAQFAGKEKPDIICLDFADPDAGGRALVQKIKLDYPSVPLLMFTTSQSVDLLIWAMRTRVWDCFIKPVSCGEVVRRLNILLPVLCGKSEASRRQPLMPERNPLSGDRRLQGRVSTFRTRPVLPFLEQHFHEKITLPEVARLCRMDTFEFSRCFRREQGVTFRDYLIRLRIQSAARRLRRDGHSILDIACSVGFNDPSQFARLFRRHMGVTPSAYRNAIGSAPVKAEFATG